MSNRLYSKRVRYMEEKRSKVRRKSPRPKSFKTEAAAKKWAEANKVAGYSLKNLKSPESRKKKIVIVGSYSK